LLGALALLAIVLAILLPPIPQDPRYHNFADQREWWRIPFFWNVVTNLPFILAGLYGLWVWPNAKWDSPGDRWPWFVVAASSILVGLGSGYYHWAPNNNTLFWDRLPMTLFFMAIFCAAIAERIHAAVGLLLLTPFLALGVFSVEVWRRGELSGVGDLRFYALVQFYPMIALPAILLLYRSRYSHANLLWHVIGYYVAAKFAEGFDRKIYAFSGYVMSGHAIKHLLGARAVFVAMRMLQLRRPL
jgi:hypothetical protein